MEDVYIQAPENINSCELVLEEVHYQKFLVLQEYGLYVF